MDTFFQLVTLKVQSSLGESSEISITRLCKMLCFSHDDQRAGSFLKQRISMALLIGRAPCVLGTMSDRDAFEKIYYIYLNFFKPLFHNRKKFYRSTGIVAGMSSLLVVFLLLVYWDSGWYGVPYFRCRPRVCVSPPPSNMMIRMAFDWWRISMISDRS